MKIGIIGRGSFGAFAARVLTDAGLTVATCDKGDDIHGVVGADALILAVPLAAYSDILSIIKKQLLPKTLVIDICSVKTGAAARLHQQLPKHKNLLITHPMFGPQSAANGTAGHTLVVTEAEGERAQKAIAFCRDKLGLNILHMTNEEHDRAMADVHALTFFVARGLSNLELEKSPFQAPSFQMLLDLVAFDQTHSEELFRTIELGNPYAKDARIKLITALELINDKLERQKI